MRKAQGLALVAVGFVFSRVGYAAAGVRFDDSALHPHRVIQVQWQLLDLGLLRHDLWRSAWNLQSQPPLYNLYCGLLLHLPAGLRQPVAAVSFLTLGLAMVTATFLLLAEFGVATWLAAVVTLGVVADPAMVLYENWLSWSYPSAAFVTVGGYGLVRLLRTGERRWAAVSATCLALVVLTDATFQWPWLLAIGIVAGVGVRAHWRRVALAVVVPFLVVVGWYAKDAVQFGTVTTSSWLGMNWYQTTVGRDSRAAIQAQVDRGTISPLAALRPFGPVSSYVPRFVAEPNTGIPALDEQAVELGVPNLNNLAYVAVSRRYLRDDIAALLAQPSKYASTVGLSTEVWALPAIQNPFVRANYPDVAGYAMIYDRLVLLQPDPAGPFTGALTPLGSIHPTASDLSWAAVCITVVDVALTPLVLIIRRRQGSRRGLGVLWLTVSYSFAVTSMTEVGENMRFRFELGTLPLIVGVVTVATLATWRRQSSPCFGPSN
jgi:hypothetical protein